MTRNGAAAGNGHHDENLQEQRLGQIIADYADRINAGESVSAEDVLGAHPELAANLAPALEALETLKPATNEETPLGTFGDYTLRRRVGRGGMGVVYDAWEKSMNRQVALKVLPPGVAADSRTLARFVREAQVSGNLHHPNVVPVYGMGVKEKTPYYAMEYVEGETLGQILTRLAGAVGPVQKAAARAEISRLLGRNRRTNDATEIGFEGTNAPAATNQTAVADDSTQVYFTRLADAFAEVADGLEHAHSKSVIHRDIKPSNLMLDRAGRLRILDFGLARLEGQETITMTGDFIGTPLYMSPEQAKRRKVPVDYRTDIYSLGATMYEMLVLQPPFRGNDPRDTLSRIIESDPQPLRKLETTVPKELETIVLTCLRKQPADRYATAEALAQDLRRFVSGDPIEARPQPAWEKLSRRLWRSRMRIAVCAMILAFLSIVGYLLLKPQATAIRLVWRAPAGRSAASFQGEISHDGRYLSFADWDSGNLVVRDLVEGRNRALTKGGSWTAPVGYADGSVWSPDGDEIAYTWYDGEEDLFELRTVKVSDPTPRILYRHRENIRPGDWSADGKSIFGVFMRLDKTNQIAQVSVADGSLRVLKSVDWRWPGPLRLSPDDRFVAYSFPPEQDSSEHDIYVLATDGSTEKRVVKHPANDELLGWLPDGNGIIFTSDRRGSVDLWSVELEQGDVKGPAQLVKTGIGTCEPFGFTQKSAFYYGAFTGLNDVYVGSLDLETGKFDAEPTRVADFFEGKNQRPDWSFDGKHLAYLSQRSPGGGFDFILRSLESGQEKTFRLRESFDQFNVRLSPDARSALVMGSSQPSGRRGIYLLDTQTGVLSPFLLDLPGSRLASYPSTTSWSPSGKSVFYVRWGNGVGRIIEHTLETGDENEVYRETVARAITSLVPSHDGSRLAISTRLGLPETTSTFALNVISLTGGEPRELVREKLMSMWPIAWTPDGEHVLFEKTEQTPNGQLRSLWRISADGEQQKLDVDISRMRQLRMHSDGRQLAFVMGETLREVWVLEEFQLENEQPNVGRRGARP